MVQALAAEARVRGHCCVIDAVFYLVDGELRISELPALGKADIAAIQIRVSRRVLRWFVRRGLLDPDDARAMREWHNDGGFSLDAAVRIPAWDRAGLERLLRYCARPPLPSTALRLSMMRTYAIICPSSNPMG